jgi:hypothetical protein
MNIEISDGVAELLAEFMADGPFASASDALFNIITAFKQDEEILRNIRSRLGQVQYEELTGVRRRRGEPDPNYAKVVIADPLFNNGYHSAWGADCPVCKHYFFEDCDVTPLTKEERSTKCDCCDQKIALFYPWETSEALFPANQKESKGDR